MKLLLLSSPETAIERPRKRRRNDVPSSLRGDICLREGGREGAVEEAELYKLYEKVCGICAQNKGHRSSDVANCKYHLIIDFSRPFLIILIVKFYYFSNIIQLR